MHGKNLVINRNAIVTELGEKVEIALYERRVTVTVSSKLYRLLLKLTEEGVSFENFFQTNNEKLSGVISTLLFNDILLCHDDDELLKDGILHNPARIDRASLSIPDTRLEKWCFFGAPADFALDPPRSPAHGPYIFRKLGQCHAEMRDLGDVAYATTDNIYSFGKKIQHIIRKVKEKNNNAMMFGGDHSLTYFALKEISQFTPEVILIQLDAHSDINNSTEKSNNNLFHANFVSRLVNEKIISAVIQIGVREKTKRYSQNYLKASSIVQFPSAMKSVHRKRLASLIKGKRVYISFDADALDPGIFPHVTTPLDNGMSEQDIVDILNTIRSSCYAIEGADIMEFTCGFDEKGQPFNYEIPLLDRIISKIIH